MHLQPTGVAFVLYWVTLTESNSQPISTGINVFSDVIGGFVESTIVLTGIKFALHSQHWKGLQPLEEGEYRENCLCLAVLCTIIMVHKDTSSSYRSVNCIGL